MFDRFDRWLPRPTEHRRFTRDVVRAVLQVTGVGALIGGLYGMVAWDDDSDLFADELIGPRF